MQLVLGVVLGVLSSGCASLAFGREAVARRCGQVTQAVPLDTSLAVAGSRIVDALRAKTSLDELAQAKVHAVTAQVRHWSLNWRRARPL